MVISTSGCPVSLGSVFGLQDSLPPSPFNPLVKLCGIISDLKRLLDLIVGMLVRWVLSSPGWRQSQKTARTHPSELHGTRVQRESSPGGALTFESLQPASQCVPWQSSHLLRDEQSGTSETCFLESKESSSDPDSLEVALSLTKPETGFFLALGPCSPFPYSTYVRKLSLANYSSALEM